MDSQNAVNTAGETAVETPEFLKFNGGGKLAEKATELVANSDKYFGKAHIANILVNEGLIEPKSNQDVHKAAKARVYHAFQEQQFALDEDGEGVFAEELRKHSGNSQYSWYARGDIVQKWLNTHFKPKERLTGYQALHKRN